MRCANCTTELWGTPETCPVCGRPTGLTGPGGRRTRASYPAAPETAAPPQEPGAFRRSGLLNPAALNGWQVPQGTPLFNASDLLDPAVLEDIPQAEPEPGSSADAIPPQPLLNAVDLFDPEVLADLSLGGAEEESGPEGGSQPGGWLLDAAEEEEQPPAPDVWERPTRQATGSIGPIFSLPPHAGPIPPPRPSAPIYSQPLPPDDDPAPALTARLSDEPDELEIPPERGWRVVSPSPPPNWQGSRPTRPHPAYPPAAYPPMPVPRAAPPRRRERATGQHGLMRALGGWMSMLLVLSIISAAIAYGAIRYFQLEGSQTNEGPVSGPLPTVAPKAGYLIYHDASLGVSLQYPGSWQEQAAKDQNDPQYTGDIFSISPDTALEIGSSPQYQNLSPAQIDDAVLTNPPGIANVSNATLSIPTDSTIPIAGLNWTPEDATVALSNGQILTMTCLAISYNGRGYAIFYFANQQIFNSYDSQYFEPILLSFRFLT